MRRLNKITIDNTEAADACTREQVRGGSPNRATAHHHTARREQPPLAFFTNAGKKHLPRIFFTDRIDSSPVFYAISFHHCSSCDKLQRAGNARVLPFV